MQTVNPKRRALGLTAGWAFGLGALAHWIPAALAQVAATPARDIRFATSSLDTSQCVVPVGADAGVFAKHGVSMHFPALAAGAAEAMTGLLEGRWDFAHVGLVPLARQALEGRDAVLIVTPMESHRAGILVTRSDIRSPEELAGARVGVLSEAGESAAAARYILQSLAVFGTLVPLGRNREIYAALQTGRIDAGYLPLELAFAGRRRLNWNSFEGGAAGIPGGIATTRTFIRENAALVDRVVTGCIEAIRLFKADAGVVIPLLQRRLNLADVETARELWDFHAPLFRAVPRPTLFSALTGLREALTSRYPKAPQLRQDELLDPSFVEALERSGYIRSLYNAGA